MKGARQRSTQNLLRLAAVGVAVAVAVAHPSAPSGTA